MTYERVLREFGRDQAVAMRRYRRFVAEGLDAGLDSPLDRAVHGLLLGTDAFVTRMRELIRSRPEDPGVPTLGRLRLRPKIEKIIAAVAEAFNADPSQWNRGRRDNGIARSAAAWMARHRLGYPARTVADALGYRGSSSVTQALRRVEQDHKRIASTLARIERKLAND